jgi:hypothetical protein
MKNISSIRNALSPEMSVKGGYGEYLIFRKAGSLSKETYALCYDILSEARQIVSEKEKRTYLKREFRQIDEEIGFTFIPRTLYELYFIEKCVKETLRRREICKSQDSLEVNQSESKCWHGPVTEAFERDADPSIFDIAYRLNNSICKHINPATKALSFATITAIAQEKLNYIENCHEYSDSALSKELLNYGDCRRDLANNIMSESTRGSAKPVGIKTEAMKQIVLNAISLECSNLAQGNWILYRGSKLNNDSPLEYSSNGEVSFVQSLSFGTSLFAGSMYDPGAAAFHYMRNRDNDAIAILVPKPEASSSPFAIPSTHPISQIFGNGERWHARTKAPTIGVNSEVLVGCKSGRKLGKIEKIEKHFLWDVTPREFEDSFNRYRSDRLLDMKN